MPREAKNADKEHLPSISSIGGAKKRSRVNLTSMRKYKIKFFTFESVGKKHIIGRRLSSKWIRNLTTFINDISVDENCVMRWLKRDPSLVKSSLKEKHLRSSDHGTLQLHYPEGWITRFQRLFKTPDDEIVKTASGDDLTTQKFKETMDNVKKSTTIDIVYCVSSNELNTIITQLAEVEEPWMMEHNEMEDTAQNATSTTNHNEE